MNIVSIDSQPTLADSMEVIRQLTEDVENGKIIAFVVSALSDDDTVYVYEGASKPVSQLRMQGAMLTALHMYVDGEV